MSSIIKITEPSGSVQTYTLEDGDRFVVGRSLDCDVRVPVASVSRQHVIVESHEKRIYVRTYHPSKEARLKDKPLTNEPTPLGWDDKLEFGGAVLELITEEEESTLQDAVNPLSTHWEAVWLAYCPGATRAQQKMQAEASIVVSPLDRGTGMRPVVAMYVLDGGPRTVCAVKTNPFLVQSEGLQAVVQADVLWTPRLSGFQPVPVPSELLPEVRAPMELRSHTGLELPERIAIFGGTQSQEHGQLVIRQVSDPLVIVSYDHFSW